MSCKTLCAGAGEARRPLAAVWTMMLRLPTILPASNEPTFPFKLPCHHHPSPSVFEMQFRSNVGQSVLRHAFAAELSSHLPPIFWARINLFGTFPWQFMRACSVTFHTHALAHARGHLCHSSSCNSWCRKSGATRCNMLRQAFKMSQFIDWDLLVSSADATRPASDERGTDGRGKREVLQ
jgi:hypothetical protein